MTVRAGEFDVLAAKVNAGELTEREVIAWMAAGGWPGHSVLECRAWWETEYAARRKSAGAEERKG